MIENPKHDLAEPVPSATTLDATAQRQAMAELFEGVAPGILRGRQAFLRDLPALLADAKYDRWSAAYIGEERIAFSASQRDVIRECLRRGLKDDEYFIGMVVPYDDEEELDNSLRKFDE